MIRWEYRPGSAIFLVWSQVRDESALPALREAVYAEPGPFFACVETVAESLPLVFPHSFDGVTAVNRFRDAATS